MKTNIKKSIKIVLAFIVGLGISYFTVSATIDSSIVQFDKNKYGTKTNVKDALDELYQQAKNCISKDKYKMVSLNQKATVELYDSNTKISSGSSCTNNDITNYTCFGNYTLGKWRRMSAETANHYYYTKLKIALPSGVTINSSTNWMLVVGVYGNYSSGKASKEDNNFRIGGQQAMINVIPCFNSNPSYFSMTTIDNDNKLNSGGALITECGIQDGYIYVQLKTSADNTSDDASSKFSYRTRASEFTINGNLYYNQ